MGFLLTTNDKAYRVGFCGWLAYFSLFVQGLAACLQKTEQENQK